MSVRQVEQAIRKKEAKPDAVKEALPTKLSAYIEDAENRLRSRLATKVNIKARTKGGSVEIEFYDDDDLDRVINAILNE